MQHGHAITLAVFAINFLVATGISHAQARGRGAGGSTPQGDILRGEGAFLQGAGWYELNSAKGRSIDERTLERIANWNENYFESQKHLYNAYRDRKKGELQKAYDARVAKHMADESRFRTSPTQDDVMKGLALNALLLDLSSPKLTDTDWRLAKVPLPPGMSIRDIVYRFAPKPDAKGSEGLSHGVIALSRLDVKEWPIVLRDRKLAAERNAYEASYAKVSQECVDKDLSIPSVQSMSSAIKSLKGKASIVVPAESGYRKNAVEFVDRLDEAARMFEADTLDYAAEIVKDTREHDATTVGELLAFMRKYRLIFSSAEGVRGGGDTYAQLYGAMRKQKEALGIKDGPAPEAVHTPSRNDARPISKDDMITKIVATRSFVNDLDFRGNAERRPHKMAAFKALQDAEATVKAGRFPKDELAGARREVEALFKIGISGLNAQRAQSARQIIDQILKMTN
jgi:hypothetical protein